MPTRAAANPPSLGARAAGVLLALALGSCGGTSDISIRLKGSCPSDALNNNVFSVWAVLVRADTVMTLKSCANTGRYFDSLGDLQHTLNQDLAPLAPVPDGFDWTLYVAGVTTKCCAGQASADVHLCGVAETRMPPADDRLEVPLFCEPQPSNLEMREKMKPCLRIVQSLTCGK